jgi:hypothetical protein
MIAIGRRSTSEQTRRSRVYPTGAVGAKSEWMMTGEDPKFSPTVFLYEQPPNQTLAPHFHHNNEFQIFIEGEGKLGARKVTPVTVHYAGAYTAYGPIVAGPEGLKYFTLRTVHESGAILVANSEGKWPAGPRRHATGKPLQIRAMDELELLSEAKATTVLARADDGLEATSLELPPNARVAPIHIGGGEGVFVLMLAGSLVSPDCVLNQRESLYVTEDEGFPTLLAGERGAHLLTLIPPKRDPAYA